MSTTEIRHNWQMAEILDLFAMPFNDLLFKAQSTHRQHFDPNAVQVSTLLSIKTGGCSEDWDESARAEQGGRKSGRPIGGRSSDSRQSYDRYQLVRNSREGVKGSSD